MARRGNGEGSIFQRKDGRWVGAVYVLLPSGGRSRRFVYGHTREDVHQKVTKLLAQVQDGVVASNTQLTVEQYLSTWLEDVAKRRVRPRTFDLYRMLIRRHIVPAIGRKRLARLTVVDVRRFLNSKADAGLSPSSVKKLHIVLGSALQQAVRDELLTKNVARLVQVPVPKPAPVDPYTLEEARALLAAAKGHRLYAFWAVAIGLGLRRGEALALRWEDVDLDGVRPTLRVARGLQRIDGQLVFHEPKTARSRRTIPLPAALARTLKAHRAEQNAERLAAGADWHDLDLVFATKLGGPVEPGNMLRSLAALCEQAGVRRLRVHDLRHTCATLLLAQGVPLRVVMELLGHSAIGVTANTYGHVVPALMHEATEQLHDALAADDGDVDVKKDVSGSGGPSDEAAGE
jgi:integrase